MSRHKINISSKEDEAKPTEYAAADVPEGHAIFVKENNDTLIAFPISSGGIHSRQFLIIPAIGKNTISNSPVIAGELVLITDIRHIPAPLKIDNSIDYC